MTQGDQHKLDPTEHGEGNRAADRRYRESTREFIEQGRVESNAQAAKLSVEELEGATTEEDVKQLNSFLRGELAAVETYEQVIAKADSSAVSAGLREGRDSHQKRVRLLQDHIRSIGGDPEKSSGAWGSFARALEGGAKLFGISAAVSVLEGGESHGLKDYERNISDLSPECQRFVRASLLPEQHKTHALLSRLEEQI